MKSKDIRKSQTIVIYDTGSGMFANRAAFMFRAMGHPNVRLLDGHFKKWKQEGKPVEGAEVDAAEFDYVYNGDNVSSYEDIC